jgi:hypothetical protein
VKSNLTRNLRQFPVLWMFKMAQSLPGALPCLAAIYYRSLSFNVYRGIREGSSTVLPRGLLWGLPQIPPYSPQFPPQFFAPFLRANFAPESANCPKAKDPQWSWKVYNFVQPGRHDEFPGYSSLKRPRILPNCSREDRIRDRPLKWRR